MFRFIVCTSIFLVISFPVYPETIYVPQDFNTIQEAIDASTDGDIVLVDQGTYVENINYHGKWITVKSVYGPESTIIEGMQGNTVSFIEGENYQSILDGFTVRRFFGELGRGIICIDSSPVITNNVIQMNRIWAFSFDGMGAGIYLENSDENNILRY